MENQANSKSIITNYGLILGVLTILLNLTVYALGMHFEPHWSISVISGVLFIGIIAYGIKKFKESNNGFMSWGEGLKTGVGIAIICALIVVIYNYVFMNFIEPDFMNQMTEIQNEKFLEAGMSDDQIEAANEMGKSFKSPFFMAAIGIIAYAIGGFIVSAISAAIMKKSEEDQY